MNGLQAVLQNVGEPLFEKGTVLRAGRAGLRAPFRFRGVLGQEGFPKFCEKVFLRTAFPLPWKVEHILNQPVVRIGGTQFQAVCHAASVLPFQQGGQVPGKGEIAEFPHLSGMGRLTPQDGAGIQGFLQTYGGVLFHAEKLEQLRLQQGRPQGRHAGPGETGRIKAGLKPGRTAEKFFGAG